MLAGRGLGLSFVKHILEDPDARVVAAARDPASSTGLKELADGRTGSRLFFVSLEVGKEDSARVGPARDSVACTQHHHVSFQTEFL